VRAGATAVSLDFGPGAVANVRSVMEYDELDGIVVSHMHADHFLDAVPLWYALLHGPRRRAKQLPLWLPPGGESVLRKLFEALDPRAGDDLLDRVFALCEFDPAQALEMGDLTFTFAPVRHFISAYAIRVTCGSTTLTYSGDTAPCDGIVEHAANSALLLCEATLGLGSEEGERGHSSAREAGEIARLAQVGRLALTHYGTEYSREALVEAARAQFDGPVCAVDDADELSL
jgi:ribonuclease BN (tRNA processing enzyme)